MAKRKKPRKLTRKRIIKERVELFRPMIREAARTGLVEAIEHCGNFWQVGDDYKKYIEHQIASQAKALELAVRVALRDILAERPWKRRKRPKP
jgi:hypothetical protein